VSLPLSKPADLLGDAEALGAAYAYVDRYPDALVGQHAIRRWEYAMALYAIEAWELHVRAPHAEAQAVTHGDGMVRLAPLQIADIGGAGSNFWQVLTGMTSEPIDVIDPSLPESGPTAQTRRWGAGVETLAANGWISHECFDILTCISVIEHVQELRPFFRACRMLLKPGGLLFLTTDYWDSEGPDVAHFHWMRERIYNEHTLSRLISSVGELGFARFGTSQWRPYPGPQLYDYSVASVALTRKDLR
jgi:SAM-dependent methyltransferase